MNIPANDAFTLNSRSHRRRSITRSPPPKFSFFSPSPAQPRQGTQMSLRHRPVANGSTLPSDVSSNGEARELVQKKAKANKVDNVQKRHASPPIDWEVPRKLLHSSIGTLKPSQSIIPIFMLAMRRLCRHPSVYNSHSGVKSRHRSLSGLHRNHNR